MVNLKKKGKISLLHWYSNKHVPFTALPEKTRRLIKFWFSDFYAGCPGADRVKVSVGYGFQVLVTNSNE